MRLSDAVYSNLRGDVPAKLGIGYSDLKHLNHAVVCCSLSGFGMTGRRAAKFWRRLASAMGHPEWLADPHYTGFGEGSTNRGNLLAKMEAAFRTATVAEWLAVFEPAGISPIEDCVWR